MSNGNPENSFLRRVMVGAGWIGIATMVQRGLRFAILPIMTFYLTVEDYGVLALTAVVVSVVAIFQDWGFGVGFARVFFEQKYVGRRELLFTVTFAVFCSSALLYGLTYWAAPYLAAMVLDDWRPEFDLFLRLQLLATSLNVVHNVARSYLLTIERPQQLAKLTLITSFVAIGLQLFFLIVLQWGLAAVYWTQLFSAMVMFLAGLIFTRSEMVLRPRLTLLKDVIKVGWASIPINGFGYLVRLGDRLVIQATMPLSMLGIYNVGTRFEDMHLVYNNAMKGAWRPANTRFLTADASDELLRDHANYLLEVTVIVTAAIALFAREMVILLTAEPFHSVYVVVPILVLGAMFRMLNLVPNNRLIFEKKLPYALVLLIPSAGAQIGIAWWLIPHLGLAGAALGSVSAYLTSFLLNMAWAYRFTRRKLQLTLGRWLYFILLATLAAGLGSFAGFGSFWNWALLKGGFFVIVVLSVMILERQRLLPLWDKTYQRYLARV